MGGGHGTLAGGGHAMAGTRDGWDTPVPPQSSNHRGRMVVLVAGSLVTRFPRVR